MIELGITTFGETTVLEETNQSYSHPERIRQLVAEIELADQVGLDVYGIGEHHREDFAVSAPEIVLAAGAVRTNNIRLSSAVTILSSNDPIRVYQQFSTIDALSNGRSEIMAGRGSFIESFPLFGYDLADYDDLFNEKMDMLLAINSATNLDWKGHLNKQLMSDQFIQEHYKDSYQYGWPQEEMLILQFVLQNKVCQLFMQLLVGIPKPFVNWSIFIKKLVVVMDTNQNN